MLIPRSIADEIDHPQPVDEATEDDWLLHQYQFGVSAFMAGYFEDEEYEAICADLQETFGVRKEYEDDPNGSAKLVAPVYAEPKEEDDDEPIEPF